MKIHPTAIVSPDAQLGQDIEIGPFCVVEPGVVLGDGCRLEARASVKERCILGPRNHIGEGTVIGGLPQHLKMPEKIGDVLIGADNTFRENVTVNRSTRPEKPTTLGDRVYLMAGVHLGHDCQFGSNITVANGSMFGGHVVVEDRAFVSGGVAVHQFCRIGSFAMVGGQSKIVKDLAPYVTFDGSSNMGGIVGLNLIGLKRNGFGEDQLAQLKEAYRLIFRSNLRWADILRRLEAEFPEGPAGQFLKFFRGGTRGFIQERRQPKHVTVPLPAVAASEKPGLRIKAG